MSQVFGVKGVVRQLLLLATVFLYSLVYKTLSFSKAISPKNCATQ
jgi:hypothetical protein